MMGSSSSTLNERLSCFDNLNKSSLNTIGNSFISTSDMKQRPIFKEIFVESGHPDYTVDSVTEQLEDMGFNIEKSGSSISQDNTAEGIKTYLENIKATRSEKEYRTNSEYYKKLFWIGLIISAYLTFIFFNGWKNLFMLNQYRRLFLSSSFIITLSCFIGAFVLNKLSLPIIKEDNIWIKVKGKIYSGTKARESRETGKNKAGVTRTATSVYIYSELTFSIAGDSQIDIDRIREDVNGLSKHIQKL